MRSCSSPLARSDSTRKSRNTSTPSSFTSSRWGTTSVHDARPGASTGARTTLKLVAPSALVSTKSCSAPSAPTWCSTSYSSSSVRGSTTRGGARRIVGVQQARLARELGVAARARSPGRSGRGRPTRRTARRSPRTRARRRSVADRVPPHLERAHRVVGPDVEDRSRRRSPTRARSRRPRSRRAGRRRTRGRGSAACGARRRRRRRSTRAGPGRARARGRRARSSRGRRRARSRRAAPSRRAPSGVPAGRRPCGRVLRALERPGEVLPRTLAGRRRHVGLLHPAADLLEDPSRRAAVGAEHPFRVGVLRLEVGDHLGVLTVAEPVVGVDADVAVAGQLDGTRRGHGGIGGHAAESAKRNEQGRCRGPSVRCAVMPTSTPIAHTEAEIAAVAFDAAGLVPAIVQEESTGEVLMVAWMNEESLRKTLETGRTWFWSRSRQEYWCKGETSGDRQYVRAGVLRLRRRRPALHGRAGGPRRLPHGRALLLLPGVRLGRHARPKRVTRPRGAEAVARRVPRAGARPHRRPGLARGARRPRDAGLGVPEDRRRRRGLPARVGRARRALGPVLVHRPRPGRHADRARQRRRGDRRRSPTASPPTPARSRRSRRCSRTTGRRSSTSSRRSTAASSATSATTSCARSSASPTCRPTRSAGPTRS